MKIQVEIFESARVVASTLVGSDNAVLKGRRFTTLYIDEAGQALEAACWIAIRKADRVILPATLPVAAHGEVGGGGTCRTVAVADGVGC